MRGFQTGEVPALHGAGETLTDGRAGDVDKLAGDEVRRGKFGAYVQQLVGTDAEFNQLALGLDAGLGVVALHGAIDALGLAGADAKLNGVLFFDYGRGFGEDESLSVFELRKTAGLEGRWISPFGPIRVDYAWPVVKENWDKTENIRFSFGTRF